MRRLIAGAALALGLTACTPFQAQQWQDWYRKDPSAAVDYANRGCPGTTGCQVDRSSYSPTPGNCDSYVPLFQRYGLPSSTFKAIAWRESGCNHRSFVIDNDDAGGGLLGLNLKGNLAATWYSWCGLTLSNVTNAETNVRCASVAYRKLGLQPWS